MFMSEVACVGCIEAKVQRYKTRYVVQRDDLRVLHPIAQCRRLGVQRLGGGEAVQHLAVGLIADRVHGHLVTVAQRVADHRGQLRR